MNKQTIMLKINSDVFVDDIFNSFMKQCGIDKQIKGSKFRFKFVDNLHIRWDKVNVPKVSSYIQLGWHRISNIYK